VLDFKGRRHANTMADRLASKLLSAGLAPVLAGRS
jgi:hypothetical protein